METLENLAAFQTLSDVSGVLGSGNSNSGDGGGLGNAVRVSVNAETMMDRVIDLVSNGGPDGAAVKCSYLFENGNNAGKGDDFVVGESTENGVVKPLNDEGLNENGGQDGVVAKCSSVADETQLQEVPFINDNNAVDVDVLFVGENGKNGDVKMISDDGLHEGDSARKAEALEYGVSLVVGVQGYSNGDTQCSANEVVEVVVKYDRDPTSTIGLGIVSNRDQKELFPVNCSIENEEKAGDKFEERPEITNNCIDAHEKHKELEEEEEEDAENQDHKFSVGEFVWAKTLNRPWWPGQIYDPLHASKDIAMYYRKDRVLVAFFGDDTSAWCYPSLVKPFQKKFQQMSTRGNSSSFYNAVEEALTRIGTCVESEMRCYCATPEIQTKLARPLSSSSGIREGVVVPEGRISGLSVTDFEPAKFLAHLRCIAEDVSEISLLERTVLGSQLLSFNRANGWCQLNIYLELLGISDCRGNSEDATIDGFDFDSPTGVALVRPLEADWPPLTVNNDIGRSSSAEKICQKKRRSMDGCLASASTKRKKNTNFEVSTKGHLAEYGSGSGKLASSSKKQEKAKPSRSVAFSDSKDINLQNDDVEGKEKNKTGSLSRERKKSKYLSPPYTMLSQEHKSLIALKDSVPDPQKVPRVSHGEEYTGRAGGLIKCSGGTIRKKQSSGKKIEANVDASEILSEFYSAAMDPMYLEESKKYDCVKGFFLNFRSYRHGSEPGSLEKDMRKTDHPTSLGGTEGNAKDGEDNTTSRSPRRKPLGKALGLPGENLHETDCTKPPRGAKKKGRDWKEDARSQIPHRKTVDIPLSSLGEDLTRLPTCEGDRERNERDLTEDAKLQMSPGQLFDIIVGSSQEYMHTTDHPTSGAGARKRGRKRKKDTISESLQLSSEHATSITNKKRCHNKEAKGKTSSAALILNFGPGGPLPTKEDLITLFGRFGDLNKLETKVMEDSGCAQIVYKSRSNAEEAFNSSQKVSPFGPAAVNYGLQDYTTNSRASKPKANLQQSIHPPTGGNALTPVSAVPPTAEAPPLQYVRQNLENMTSMLEKAGDKLPPEVKANLENEIKRLLKKVETVA